MIVGLRRITSSRFFEDLVVLPRIPSDKPGMPPRASRASVLIRPPIATILLSTTRTMVSVSLTVLLASGSVIAGLPPPMFTTRVLSVTSLTDGWMCRMMLLPSSICGVTSSTIPEKQGRTVIVGAVDEAPAVVVVLVVMLVTKNSSVPTLSTAFWLLIVAMRGL